MSYYNIFKKNKTMNLTFHKLVLNVMAGPNPTQYTKSGKQFVKLHKHGIGQKSAEICLNCLLIAYWLQVWCSFPASVVPMCLLANI